MKTKAFLVACAILGLSLAWALGSARRAEQARVALATLAPQTPPLREKINGLEVRLQTAHSALGALEQNVGAATPAKNGSAGGVSAVGGDGAPSEARARPLSAQTLVANNPQKMAEYLTLVRGGLDCDYGWIFKRLNLSPAQIEKFKDIETGLTETSMDLQAATELHRLDRDTPEGKRIWEDYNQSRIAKKAELLGADIVPYLELFRTRSVRDYAFRLAWTGIFTGETATADQINRASDILVANSKRRVTDGYPGWADVGGLNWPAAKEALRTVLSPTQIETVGNFVQRDAAYAKVDERAKLLTAQFKGQPSR